jgi:hypothetical protein
VASTFTPRPPSDGFTYTVFLSSSSEVGVVELRDRVDALITQVITPQLQEAGTGLAILVDRWENTAAQKSATGHVNDEFIRRATESDLVIVILFHELRPGTHAEINAVIGLSEVDLALLQFGPLTGKGSRKVQHLLADNRERIKYSPVPDPSSDLAWHEIMRVLLRLVIRGLDHVYKTRKALYVDEVAGSVQ